MAEGFEVAVLVDTGAVTFAGRDLARAELGVVEAVPHPSSALLEAGAEGARVLVLGGEPFGEQVVMWWNFIGRSHEDVVAAREAWEAGAGARPGGRPVRAGRGVRRRRSPRIPAPGPAGGAAQAPGQPGAGNRVTGASGFAGAEAPALS